MSVDLSTTTGVPGLPLPSDRASADLAAPPGRSLTDHALLDLVRPLLPAAGITRVADLTGLDDVGLPVVSAIRPNARSLSIAAGKGRTLAAATASAVMEALETHAAETFRPPLTLAPAREVDEDLGDLPGTAVARDDETPILWCDAIDLVDGGPRHAPFGAVHTDWSLPHAQDAGWFVRDSNGLASGQTDEEALLHALCELVERDASRCHDLLSEWARDARRFVPEGSLVTPVLDRAQGAGRLVGCWDLTGTDGAGPTPIGIPVVAAVLLEAEDDPFRPLPAGGGLGAHPDPEVAAVRAITEAAQSRLVTISGARDDLDRGAFQRFFDRGATERIRARVRAVRPRTDGPAPAPYRTATELAGRVAELTGHRPLAVDLTPADWPIRVARVLAPGLEAALNESAREGRRARSARLGANGAAS